MRVRDERGDSNGNDKKKIRRGSGREVNVDGDVDKELHEMD